jgi:hypothetical protein
MDNEKLEYTKFRERLDFAIAILKDKCKEENINFSEGLLREASDIARCLFVRSEIQYSSKR